MMKRSGKFYRRNEEEVMLALGLKPTKNSGSGWVEKEDGQSDEVICQLKSTDASSIRIKKEDLDTLEYNAAVSHKLPVFAVQFLQSNEVFIMMKPEDINDLAKYLKTGETPGKEKYLFDVTDLDEIEFNKATRKRTIKSSSKAREQYHKEHEEKFKKETRSAK